MTLQFYAQPYDLSATGFYFKDGQDFQTKSRALRNDHGDPVEEFEIQIIEGNLIDIELFNAIGVHQGTITQIIAKCCEWDDFQKTQVIIAVGECGYSFDLDKDEPLNFDIDIYEIDSMKELAEQFVDEGLLGDIPEALENYIDYEAIARDLSFDYSEAEIAGKQLIYRCS